jgi:hypothetical protein
VYEGCERGVLEMFQGCMRPLPWILRLRAAARLADLLMRARAAFSGSTTFSSAAQQGR